MLIAGEYTKEELVNEFNTSRIDSIKRSLTRLGYEYETNGRNGKNLRLTITKAPNMFKMFCINELGVPAQSDFRILRDFFYYFFCDEEFQQLPVGEMARIMEEEKKAVSRQTIAKWIQFFKDKSIIYESREYLYFATVVTDISTESLQITKEEYTRAWQRYWTVKRNSGDAKTAFDEMKKVNGGVVFKKQKIEENGFYSSLIDSLVELLESE